ncbi:MAG: glycoside hydrolase family 2 protein [Phycisphaerae bacterium]
MSKTRKKPADPRLEPGELARHPRPMLTRPEHWSLDGTWQFDAGDSPDFADGQTIRVPFAPEAPLSGLNGGKGLEGFLSRCWYRREVVMPKVPAGHRLLLHFGAVDYVARVWVNGRLAVEHEGGYMPYHADVTDLLSGDKAEVLVCADDDPHDLAKPRGKQDWHEKPHSIWYPRTTGIWQSVWLEVVPQTRIDSLRWTASVAEGAVSLTARIVAPVQGAMGQLRLAVTLSHAGKQLCQDVCSVGTDGVLQRTFPVDRSHGNNCVNDLLWSPEHPRLIDAELTLLNESGEKLDTVGSYTALREVAIEGDRFLLNRSTYKLRMLLNQGYWPEGGLTPPDDDAFAHDVQLIKQLGYNGVRMHQKLESPRFLHHADRLGLLVWDELPSALRFTPESQRRLVATWMAAIERDVSHPCVVAWVPINESWATPDLGTSPAQRAFLHGLYHLSKSLDPTRPVIGNDGWEIPVGDITAVHDYEGDGQRLAARYADLSDPADLLAFLQRERPGNRKLVYDEYRPENRPLMLTEFGGIGFSQRDGDWGYTRAGNVKEFLEQYTAVMAAVRQTAKFSGYCYTQFTDTYQEANGLVYMDRTPKADIEALRKAHLG